MVFKLKVGDKLPPFSAVDQDGINITNEEVDRMCCVLFFYSKEETPLLEKFQAKMKQFDELGVIVMAVSPNSSEKLKETAKELKLNFILLSDQDHSMFKAFDVIRKVEGKGKIIPSTFVIDPYGIIQWLERPVEPAGHAERVLEAAAKV